MTKITFDTDEADSSRMINLDDILAMLIDKDAESQSKSYFDFIKTHDSSILTQIKKYTADIKEKDLSDLNEFQKETLIEETATGITDAVVKANFAYLKSGMKLGVRMLFELMA